MSKKTETRYVVERRDLFDREWVAPDFHPMNLREARAFVRYWSSFKLGREYRIVKVTTTREVVR